MEWHNLVIDKGVEWRFAKAGGLFGDDPDRLVGVTVGEKPMSYFRKYYPELMKKRVRVKVFISEKYDENATKRKPDDIFEGTVDEMLDYIDANAERFGF